jgi:intracellular multiplication protein IcmL
MSEQRQIEFKKNELYRDQYRQTLWWVLVMGVLCLFLTLVMGYLSFRQQPSRYYATMADGAVVPLYSLSQPTVTNDFLLQWASVAARSVLNLDFVHYQSQLQSAENYFTTGGWHQFQAALKSSGLLDSVISKKLIMTGVVSGAPVILNRAILHGRYTWTIQMPVLVTFSSASENSQTKLILTMNIQRVSTLSTAQGIQISDFKTQTQI